MFGKLEYQDKVEEGGSTWPLRVREGGGDGYSITDLKVSSSNQTKKNWNPQPLLTK